MSKIKLQCTALQGIYSQCKLGMETDLAHRRQLSPELTSRRRQLSPCYQTKTECLVADLTIKEIH